MFKFFKNVIKFYKDVRSYLLYLDSLAEEKLFQGPDYIYITTSVVIGLIISYFFADIENLLYYIEEAIKNFNSYRNYLVPYDINPYAYYHPKFWWDPYVLEGDMPWDRRWIFYET